jgi:hypothetical protein
MPDDGTFCPRSFARRGGVLEVRLCVLAHVVGWERGDVDVSCACFAVVWTWWVRSVEEWDATSFASCRLHVSAVPHIRVCRLPCVQRRTRDAVRRRSLEGYGEDEGCHMAPFMIAGVDAGKQGLAFRTE